MMMWPFNPNPKKVAYLQSLIPQLQPMDIVVTRDKTPISWWIRQKTSSKWSHVFLMGENGTAYTTAFKFMQTDAVKYLMDKSFAVYRLPNLSPLQTTIGIKACKEEIGTFYPVWNFALMDFENEVNPGSTNAPTLGKAKVCSQFTSWVYEEPMNAPLLPYLHMHWQMMTPGRCVEDSRLVEQGRWEE